MLVIAHRGYSSKYPQNTLEAFDQALAHDAQAIELDVHQVENEFLVFHDFYVDKLTNGQGRLSTLNLQDTQALKVLGSHSIPTLADALSLIANQALVNIELKSISDTQAFACYLVKLVNDKHCKVVISSFNHELLKDCMQHLNEHNAISFAAVIGHLPIELSNYAKQLSVSTAVIDVEMVTSEFVDHAHQNQLKVWCYTVNHSDNLQKIVELNVDGFFTDNLVWAKHQLTLI